MLFARVLFRRAPAHFGVQIVPIPVAQISSQPMWLMPAISSLRPSSLFVPSPGPSAKFQSKPARCGRVPPY